MEKVSTSKLSLKLFRRPTIKSGVPLKEIYQESVSLVRESETVEEVVHNEDVDGSETCCELHPTETCEVQAECTESERTGESNSSTNEKQVYDEEIADVFLDNREVAVVVSWNWDSSQRNTSPKAEKTTTPLSQKKRSSKICSPLMRGQPSTRRKRLLKKEPPSTKSSFVSELRALSEKLQKAKEQDPVGEDTVDCENDLCIESPNSEKSRQFRHERNTSNLDNLEEVKNDSFRRLLEDDDDCLIQCSQEVEKKLKECGSPLKKSPKLQNLGAVKFEKNSPNRTKTPLKSKFQNASHLRRSPRIRNQNLEAAHSRKPSSNSLREKIGDTNSVLDENLVESLLDDEMELLSQVPSPSVIFSRENQKPCSLTNSNTLACVPTFSKTVTRKVSDKHFSQAIVGDVNFHKGSSCATSLKDVSPPVQDTRYVSKNIQHAVQRAVGMVKPLTSSTAKKNSVNSSKMKNYGVTKFNVAVNNQETYVTVGHKGGLSSIEDKIKPFDDSFGDPALCNLLDSVESSVLSCSPVKSNKNNMMTQEIPSSPPLRCTPEEIEKKKQEALERRRSHSHQASSLNVHCLQSIQTQSHREDKVKVKPQVPSSPQRHYTPEEIEKKRLEAMQIKRQQSLFRTNTNASVPRQRLQKK